MSTVYHKNLTPSDVHICYSFLYSDESSRQMADGFSSSDVGKLARVVTPNNDLYMLISHSPPEWVRVGGTVEPATADVLGGVMVQETSGLSIDAVGNITIHPDNLLKLDNMPPDLNSALANTNPAQGGTGASRIGFGGHSSTNLVVNAKTLEAALKDVINKISQNAADIYGLKTTGIAMATENTIGGVKVPPNDQSGLFLDPTTGALSMDTSVLNTLNELPNLLANKVDSADLSANTGTREVNYRGYGQLTDDFSVPASTLEFTLDEIVKQININTSSIDGNVPMASSVQLGGIKIGEGLSIDPVSGVCSVTGADITQKSIRDLADVTNVTPSSSNMILAWDQTSGALIWKTRNQYLEGLDLSGGDTGGGTTTGGDYMVTRAIHIVNKDDPNSWTDENGGAVDWVTTMLKDSDHAVFDHNLGLVPFNVTAYAKTGEGLANIMHQGLEMTSSQIRVKQLFTAGQEYWLYFNFWESESGEPTTGTQYIEVVVHSLSAQTYTANPSSTSVNISSSQVDVNHGQGRTPCFNAFWYKSSDGKWMEITEGTFNIINIDSNTTQVNNLSLLDSFYPGWAEIKLTLLFK